MMSSDKFSCDVLVESARAFECSLPEPGILEWVTAGGTLLSALVALGLAAWSIRDSRKSRLRADEAELRGQQTARQSKVLELSKPIMSILDKMRAVDESALPRQTVDLYWAISDFRDHVSKLGDVEIKISKELLDLTVHFQYSILEIARITEVSNDPWPELRKLLYKEQRGLVVFTQIVKTVITDLTYAKTEQEKEECLKYLHENGEQWTGKYFVED
ncbi:hypothetical protein [Glutamicibacter ardleyensis]|uniref:hypothetical protein n=1 Tax=Glutamicibacter ardleyensis TaxID=225894 RepID=UPI003FD2460F